MYVWQEVLVAEEEVKA